MRVILAVAAGYWCFGMTTAALRAQDDKPPLETPESEARPYVPPAAWKSVEIGNYYLRRKKYKAALSRYQEAVGTDPYYAPAYLGLGKVYEKIGLPQKALEAYRNYLDKLPSSKEAEEAKDVHQAIARLERQLQTPRRRTHEPSSPSEDTSQPH